ncbi:permease [Roseiconus lacunae]|uniref:Permease n=1 Tax=Roseiconus lacunae TaxID=2605694 RepID=A0ABT7PKV5_9BACT|nr:permease [Roseiconus lacunae]MCD0460767.1 permease [Roseiconus lacunae]MDM4017121.1 permease [Roseiconus lacunae]
MNTPTQMLLGGFTRLLQGCFAAAPTLLTGFVIAAILRYYLGKSGTQRLFGGDSIRRLPQSWLIGMLLPVCSIGVIPILREMRRAGIKPGAMTAFALSAPLFNPLSLLYGLTLSRPLVIILFAFGSLLIVTTLGIIWDLIEARRAGAELQSSSEDVTHPPTPAGQSSDVIEESEVIGLRRLGAMAVYLGREASGATLLLTLIALSGLTVVAAALPFGAMQTSVEQDNFLAPLTMTVVAVPVYATPMLAMSQLGMMFQHGNSPGAAFSLLILGTGVNLATIVWFGRHYRWRPTAIWFTSLLTIVLGLAYAMNEPLIPPGIEPAGHTHAFDIYTNPISSHQENLVATTKDTLLKSIGIAEAVAAAVIGVLISLGILVRALRWNEATLVSANAVAGGHVARQLDRVVPRGVMGAALLLGLITLSVVACFAYYPPPEECLKEISLARAECLSASMSGDTEHALHWLPIVEEWSRRLEVGTFLRRGTVRPYQRMQGHLIRKKLELLEHELEHDPFEREEVMTIVEGIMDTNRRWVKSFRS